MSNQESEERLFKRFEFYYQIFQEYWVDITQFHNEKKAEETQQHYHEAVSRFLNMKN